MPEGRTQGAQRVMVKSQLLSSFLDCRDSLWQAFCFIIIFFGSVRIPLRQNSAKAEFR